jgi:hypothetical protein
MFLVCASTGYGHVFGLSCHIDASKRSGMIKRQWLLLRHHFFCAAEEISFKCFVSVPDFSLSLFVMAFVCTTFCSSWEYMYIFRSELGKWTFSVRVNDVSITPNASCTSSTLYSWFRVTRCVLIDDFWGVIIDCASLICFDFRVSNVRESHNMRMRCKRLWDSLWHSLACALLVLFLRWVAACVWRNAPFY